GVVERLLRSRSPFRNRRRLSLPPSDMIRQHHPDANASAVQTVEAFLLRAMATERSVTVVSARIVATRRVVAAIVSVGLRVTVRWITVAVRGIAITVGPRRQRAGDHTRGDSCANPAANTSRFSRLWSSNHRCRNAGGRENRPHVRFASESD